MTSYAVLLPGDESTWESASAEQRAAMYDKHNRFAQLLAERGHKVRGPAELTNSATGRIVSGSPITLTVTEGPYAETTAQLTGFYTVDCDSRRMLLNTAGVL